MAFSVKLIGYSQSTGDQLLKMEPPWWSTEELRKDPRFKVSNETGSYRNYRADLSVDEARELHERFKPKATSGVYDYEDWQKIIQPMLGELDSVFYKRAAEFSHIHINVFEWESGFN